MKLIFDLESDNLLDNVSQIYCICAYDLDTDTAYSFRPDEIDKACQLLEQAETLIGHNIINYDLAVIEKLYSLNLYNKKLVDTILLSKLFNADIDGGHSLAAWGERLGFPKGDHNDWSLFSEEMLAYCEQDVRVTTRLYQELSKRVDVDEAYVRMEHKVAVIQHYQEMRGVLFDKQLCLDTLAEINAKIETIDAGLEPWLGYKPVSAYKTTMKPFNKDGSYSKKLLEWVDDKYQVFDVLGEFTRIEWEKINLSTEKLLKERLMQLGWKPTLLTPTGQPKLAEKGEPCSNLAKMGGEFAAIGEYQVLKHRKGLLEGLLKVVRDDSTIPAEADTHGGVTGRATHRKIVNLPAARSPYGDKVRSMFKARDGYKIVGCDLEGIELRLLAHFMEDDAFTKAIEEGDKKLGTDAHTINMKKCGLETRDQAKTAVYLSVYGGGDEKAGTIVNGGRKEGKVLRDKLFEAMPKLKPLTEKYKKQAAQGYVVGIDGRKMRVRRDQFSGEYQTHKSLNLLIQGAGAVYLKLWMIFINDFISRSNIDAYQIGHWHDEVLLECSEKDLGMLKSILKKAQLKVDKYLQLKCKNEIDIKVGANYYEVH